MVAKISKTTKDALGNTVGEHWVVECEVDKSSGAGANDDQG